MDNTACRTDWYALKVFYNRVLDISETLREHGLEVYVPMTETTIVRAGVRHKVKRPLISSLMFVRATPKEAAGLQGIVEGRAMVYSRDRECRRVPAPIPEREMNIFMLVTSRGENGVEYIGEDSPRYHSGDRVRVTDGPFKGSEGHIVRIKSDHRLVVTVKGLCAVATSYIPRAFLEKISEE